MSYLLLLSAAERMALETHLEHLENNTSPALAAILEKLQASKIERAPAEVVPPAAPSDVPASLGCPKNLLARLKPLSGTRLPPDFAEATRLLTRPYYTLSQQMYEDVMAMMEIDSDVLLLDGVTAVTAGNADGGYALMPLSPDFLTQYG